MYRIAGFLLRALQFHDRCGTPRYKSYLMYTVVAAVFYSAGTPLLFVYLVMRFKDIGKGGDHVVSNALGWMARRLNIALLFWSALFNAY